MDNARELKVNWINIDTWRCMTTSLTKVLRNSGVSINRSNNWLAPPSAQRRYLVCSHTRLSTWMSAIGWFRMMRLGLHSLPSCSVTERSLRKRVGAISEVTVGGNMMYTSNVAQSLPTCGSWTDQISEQCVAHSLWLIIGESANAASRSRIYMV